MSDVSSWSPLDESNTAPPPDGWPEFMLPSAVNNTGRMMMGAVRRMYDKQVDGSLVLPYLKLSGGTVTGAATVNGALTGGSITSASTIYAASTISTGSSVSATLDVTAGRNMSVTGTLYAGSVVADSVSASGRVNAAWYDIGGVALAKVSGTATLLCDRANVSCISLDTGVTVGANNAHLFYNRGATVHYGSWDGGGLTINTGHLVLNSGSISGAVNLTCTGFGSFGGNVSGGSFSGGGVSVSSVNASGSVSAGDHVYGGVLQSAGPVYAYNDDGFGLKNDGNKVLSFQSDGWALKWQPGTGHAWWGKPGGVQLWLMYSDGLCRAVQNAVWGAGDYVNTSDRRLKDEGTIEPAALGLAEVLKLRPVNFKRLPVESMPDPVLETGFIAQDLAEVLPTAVREVEGTLGVATTPIVAALVNAIKAIDARLTAGGL